ncbi:MAG: 5,6-dimethylbenzimidazole synthase [Sediminibacterium magnilacihabitans]|jgi:5,6-dimethylbenzimidazole synthase|nr:5,6-dimethylbenzimidazole synthase [Sediminibacterium magnilacihabitans]PQV60998.1 cob(II)yrinic acid a,c-diamide reductase /5,6-dimethylbenzimidazole synthase [Sediminibacterium magnilacihabitans]
MQFNITDTEILRNIILHRRDVRGNRFLSTPVSSAVMDQLLFAFEHAPSVGYSQPWQLIVIEKEATKQAVKNIFTESNDHEHVRFDSDKASQYKRLKLEGIVEAPVNIAVFYTPPRQPVLGQTMMPEVGLYSVVCGIQNMWLMARSLNVGMGWVSILEPEKIKEVLHVPSHLQLVAYLCIGYVSKFDELPELELLGWERRKNQAEFIHHETFKQP